MKKKGQTGDTAQKVVVTESKTMKTDNTMRKSQHAWWKSIDNSYHPFVPGLKEKPHGISDIPEIITQA